MRLLGAALRLTGSFAVELWVKSNALNQSSKYFVNRINRYAVIYGYVTNTIEFFAALVTGCDPRPSSKIALADTNWHHIVYAYDNPSGTWAGYKDGTQIFSTACSFALNTDAGPFRIGAATDVDGNVNAVIDEVALYSAPLSGTRVQAHYTAATAP